MQNALSNVNFISSLVLMIILIILIFKRAKTQFFFVKYLYPKKFFDVNNYYQFAFSFKMYRLDFSSIIWMCSPVYYNKFNLEDLDVKGLEFHFKLVKNRKLFLMIFAIFIIWSICIEWFIYKFL